MATDYTPTVVGVFPLYEAPEVTFMRSGDLIYPVTDCCQATAKGTEWGICCRGCYEEVDSAYGSCWTVGAEWDEYLSYMGLTRP